MSTPELSSIILRYWLSLLRQEEALTTRPKARRLEHPSLLTVASVATPTAGQDYIKLPFGEVASFLVEGKPKLTVPVHGECGAFFENWLATQYRRSSEDVSMEHLVFFPALLTARQELAGLVRFGVDIEWARDNGSRFAPPTAAERAKKHYPDPPTRLEVLAQLEASQLPLFVDSRVLRELLRIDEDRLERWLSALTTEPRPARDTLQRCCELLSEQIASASDARTSDARTSDGQTSAGQSTASLDRRAPGKPDVGAAPEPAALLERLTNLVRQRLQQVTSGAKVYDIAVLLDASRNRATFHVQRDLQQALDWLDPELSEAPPIDGALLSYLGREHASGVRKPLLGRFNGQPLTDSQRAAGELFLGSPLAAIQGPPGTGKTHLILSLAAQQLLENALCLCDAKQPGQELLVVTSTNNRAVDNVIEPLTRHVPGLPLALRVGSREVMERLTAVELEKVARWLDRQPEPTDAQWKEATTELASIHAAVQTSIAGETAVRARAAELEAARLEIARLEKRLTSSQRPATEERVKPLATLPDFSVEPRRVTEAVKELKAHTTALVIRLSALSTLADPSKRTALPALDQHTKLTASRHLTPMSELLGAALPLGLPPELPTELNVDERRAVWEEATERAIAIVSELDEWIGQLYAEQTSHQRLAELRSRVQTLMAAAPEAPAAAVDWAALEPELARLFTAACLVRQLWAAKNKKPLLEALQRAAATCKSLKSLRSLLAASKGPGMWLQRLFPVWGCTLLSLGNNFAPDPESLARVVIDEAGQCHPAYAVSALLRAQSALVIGDTHQLEPVIELTAADEARLLKPIKEKHRGALAPFRAFEGSYTSAQSVADRAVTQRPVLVDHFRCQSEIALICEQLCDYGLVTRTAQRSCAATVPELDHPVLLARVSGEQRRLLGSWCNEAEVAEVAKWAAYLLRSGLLPADLGIITPFRGQLDLLWRMLRQARIPLEKPTFGEDDEQLSLLAQPSAGVALGTVHRFQGGERRVILFTTTVTETGSLRFLDERVNLVNVAASRAKEHLITIGHVPTLRAGANTRLLVQQAQERTPRLALG